jgi:hypothetical protein
MSHDGFQRMELVYNDTPENVIARYREQRQQAPRALPSTEPKPTDQPKQ